MPAAVYARICACTPACTHLAGAVVLEHKGGAQAERLAEHHTQGSPGGAAIVALRGCNAAPASGAVELGVKEEELAMGGGKERGRGDRPQAWAAQRDGVGNRPGRFSLQAVQLNRPQVQRRLAEEEPHALGLRKGRAAVAAWRRREVARGMCFSGATWWPCIAPTPPSTPRQRVARAPCGSAAHAPHPTTTATRRACSHLRLLTSRQVGRMSSQPPAGRSREQQRAEKHRPPRAHHDFAGQFTSGLRHPLHPPPYQYSVLAAPARPERQRDTTEIELCLFAPGQSTRSRAANEVILWANASEVQEWQEPAGACRPVSFFSGPNLTVETLEVVSAGFNCLQFSLSALTALRIPRRRPQVASLYG